MSKNKVNAYALVRTVGSSSDMLSLFAVDAVAGRIAEDRKHRAHMMARKRLSILAYEIGFIVRDAVMEMLGEDVATFTVTGGDGTQATLRIEVVPVYNTL